MTYTQFIDIEGGDAGKAPLVHGGYRAYYDTGLAPVPASQAQIDAARNAGMSVLLYDQWPGLASFASGRSHLADVESLAGTIADADAAIIARRKLGYNLHTIYCSYDPLPTVKASIADLTGVMFGVADYGWSLDEAEALLAANPDWAYAQYGDPNSNPRTVVPGTLVTLSQCNADINVAKDTWLQQVFGIVPDPALPAYTTPSVASVTEYVSFHVGINPAANAIATTSCHYQVKDAAGNIVADDRVNGTGFAIDAALHPGKYWIRLAAGADPGHLASPWGPWTEIS